MQRLHLDILSDKNELDDTVTPIYRKSLLYMISNALEADARMPVLGMENVYKPDHDNSWDGSPSTSEHLLNWRSAMDSSGLKSRLTVHSAKEITIRKPNDDVSEKTEKSTHGGFDNNIDLITRALQTITGTTGQLPYPVDDLVGF